MRSTLNIGSLNIAGRETNVSMSDSNHKLKFLKQMVDENRLGILAIQETHLDDAAAAEFHTLYHSWFKIIHSANPDNPTSTAGVAFLLNRKFIDVEHTRMYEMEPARALMICVPWHKGQTLTVLNIYASNTPRERNEMWARLWVKWKDNPNLPLPDIVLGDWNFVEDARDRLSGGKTIVPAGFIRLKALLQIEDAWRNTFEDERGYSCIQRRTDPITGLSRSRLDRTYVKHSIFDTCRGWKIEQTAVRSDHALVAVQLISRAEQKPGWGRLSVPLYLLKTRKFTKEIQRLGKILRRMQRFERHLTKR
jgi:exonuclease III